MKSGLMAAALAAATLGAGHANAASVFNFSWSATSAQSSNDMSMQVAGTLEIDKGAGESFDASDLLSISLEVIGSQIENFEIDGSETLTNFEGTIAGDGQSASLSNFLFANVAAPFVGLAFGCDFDTPQTCGRNVSGTIGSAYNIVVSRLSNVAVADRPSAPNGGKGTATYASAAAALASFQLSLVAPDPDPGLGGGTDPSDPPNTGGGTTPSVVPLPASAPLLLGALGGLVLMRRRRKRA